MIPGNEIYPEYSVTPDELKARTEVQAVVATGVLLDLVSTGEVGRNRVNQLIDRNLGIAGSTAFMAMRAERHNIPLDRVAQATQEAGSSLKTHLKTMSEPSRLRVLRVAVGRVING